MARVAGKNPDLAQLRADAEVLVDHIRAEQAVVRGLETTIEGATGNQMISDTFAALVRIEAAMLGVLHKLEA